MNAPPAAPARHDPATGPAWPRLYAVVLALASLLIAWISLARISGADPWYRNTDMNIHNMADALALNSGLPPSYVDQPGVPLKNLLALDYRLQHALGLLPIWNLPTFGASADPLREIPPLIHAARIHSRILVMLFILCAALLAYAVTRELDTACLAVVLLCGSSGLLFHGLLTRPELLCVGFGLVLALLCLWRATLARAWPGRHLWVFLAGLLCGAAALEKLPGVCYLTLAGGWCWLVALGSGKTAAESASAGDRASFWGGLLPLAGSVAVLWLLFRLDAYHDDLGRVVLVRLRLAAVLAGVVPLLVIFAVRHHRGSFLIDRARELALLGGGALAALPLAFLLLRCVLPEPGALKYVAAILPVLVDPGLYMKVILTAKPDVGHEFLSFLMETPWLFASATLLAVGVGLRRATPPRLRALIAVLLASALGLALVMSRRQFLAQYSIFPQVPLLLVWVLGLSALRIGWPGISSTAGRWLGLLALAAAFVLVLTAPARTRLKYYNFQDDLALPVRDLTLTFLFDHDAHTEAYRKIMRDHYGDRESFARTLEQYLADPANRY